MWIKNPLLLYILFSPWPFWSRMETAIKLFSIFMPKNNLLQINFLFWGIIRKNYSQFSNPDSTTSSQIIMKMFVSCRVLRNFFNLIFYSFLKLFIKFLKVFRKFFGRKNFIAHPNQQTLYFLSALLLFHKIS